MHLRIVLCEGQGAGNVSTDSHSTRLLDYWIIGSWIIPKKVYLFLLPGWVNIFDLKETSEVEKLEPLPLTLEVGPTNVYGAAHPSYAGSEQWAEGR